MFYPSVNQMNKQLEKELIDIAKYQLRNNDVSHDYSHAIRVLNNAKFISKIEGGDLDIIVPSALFHDIIVHPKDSKITEKSSIDSADKVKRILEKVSNYPKNKIRLVQKVIRNCSFSKSIKRGMIEEKIIQDADWLEATGAISIMRTFASSGLMARPFYNVEDPFCQNRKPQDLKYGLDLFYSRLLLIKDKIHTNIARKIAIKRIKFLHNFLKEFKEELESENHYV